MSAVYKIANAEISIASANTVYSSKLIRVTNTTSGITVLQIANTTANTANVTLTSYEVITLEKATTDTVAGTGLRAVPVAYRN